MTKRENIYLAVGDEYTFTEDDLRIRCVEGTPSQNCQQCCFNEDANRCILMCCVDEAREDGKFVHFEEVSTEEGDET